MTKKLLPDGRELSVEPMTFGKYRLYLAPFAGSMFYDDGW